MSTPWWIPLVAAAIGFMGGVIAPSITAWLTRRNEAAKWMRDQRIQAYADCIGLSVSAMFELGHARNVHDLKPGEQVWPEHMSAEQNRIYTQAIAAYHKATILASPKMRKAINGVFLNVDALVHGRNVDPLNLRKVEADFHEAVRRELKIAQER